MSEYKIACPHCGQHIAYGAEYAGTIIPCPACQGELTVPATSPAPAPVAGRPRAAHRATWIGVTAGLALLAVAAVAVIALREPETKAPTPIAPPPPTARAAREAAPRPQGPEAPDFTLNDLNGMPVHLANLAGQVVILDFWATWCPPCRKSLPVLTEVAAHYFDKGVVLYGVNQREDTQTVQNYLRSAGLGLKVLLDADGSVGRQYGVNGIPRTVIIGPDGRVRSVHVGYSSRLRDQLQQELDHILNERI